jgi:DNA end-binding protein Ku
MPPRAYWKGQLKLSLITFPVRLYNALNSSHKVSMNQLHSECKQRIKTQTVCPEHGPVPRTDLIKGYEFEKGKYVVIDEGDLERIKLESNRTLELVQFVDRDELSPVHLNTPYFVAPEGNMGEDAFCVIREAMRDAGKIGIGRVVLSAREHMFALDPDGKGFSMTTLRYSGELRSSTPYFEEIGDHEIDEDHMSLAQQLITKHSAPFDHAAFSDRYQDALMEMIRAKIEGTETVDEPQAETSNVVNLMDALKMSVEAAPKKPPAASVKSTRKKKKAKRA